MSLCVEHKLVEVDQVDVIREEQEQVLESLPQEEALHLVPRLWVAGVLHIVNRGVATCGNLCPKKSRDNPKSIIFTS